MPDEFSISDDEFRQKIANLFWDSVSAWSLWRGLFVVDDPEGSSERGALLQRGGESIQVIKYALFRTYLLGVSRLVLDPAKDRAGNANLSFEFLIRMAESEAGHELPELCKSLCRCRKQAGPVKQWRNNLLAHNDIDHVLGEKQVGPLSLERLDRIAASLDELGNLIWVALYDGEIVLSTSGFSSAAVQLLSQFKRSRDLMLLEHYAYSPYLRHDDLGRIVAEYRSKGLPDDITNPPTSSS